MSASSSRSAGSAGPWVATRRREERGMERRQLVWSHVDRRGRAGDRPARHREEAARIVELDARFGAAPAERALEPHAEPARRRRDLRVGVEPLDDGLRLGGDRPRVRVAAVVEVDAGVVPRDDATDAIPPAAGVGGDGLLERRPGLRVGTVRVLAGSALYGGFVHVPFPSVSRHS